MVILEIAPAASTAMLEAYTGLRSQQTHVNCPKKSSAFVFKKQKRFTVKTNDEA